ncbi:hypothetical protein D3C81_2045790 [compost metagenome]
MFQCATVATTEDLDNFFITYEIILGQHYFLEVDTHQESPRLQRKTHRYFAKYRISIYYVTLHRQPDLSKNNLE